MQELIQGWIPPWIGKVSWRGKWQPTPVFFPGKSHGQKSLVGSMGSRVGHNWATKQQQIVFPWKCFLFPAQKVDFLGSLFSFLVWVLHMACWEQKQKPNNWLLQKCNLYIYICNFFLKLRINQIWRASPGCQHVMGNHFLLFSSLEVKYVIKGKYSKR